MNNETKVGLFLLAAIAAILTSILTLGNVQFFSRDHRYYIDFKNVEALPPKALVKVAGVEIGIVRKVELVNGRARVTVAVHREVELHEDASARVGSTGIIGTKFIELFPGSSSTPALDNGATIKGLDGGGLNQVIEKLGTLFDTDEKNGNAADNFKETMANIRNITRALNQAMGAHGQEMEEIVMNVRDLTASLKVFSAHLEEISTEKKEDFKEAITKFKDVGDKLDALLTKVSNGEGTIGALMTDKKTEQDVKEAVTSIKDTAASAKTILGKFTSVHIYWDYRYRYDSTDDEGRHDLSIKFVPRPGKFYALGATNLNTSDFSDEEHTKFERTNRIMAVMGNDWGPFTGYIGVIRSRGGAGLNFRPLYMFPKLARRLELNLEMSDPKRDRVVQGRHLDSPWVAAGVHLALNNWLWIGERAEDLYERTAYQTYMNVVFRDIDLGYMFGLASVAHP